MKQNKKGFTLIELLAVIVILAIIALIATPIILNMISKARRSAAKSSALGFVDSVEYYTSFRSAADDLGIADDYKIDFPTKTSGTGTNITHSNVTCTKGSSGWTGDETSSDPATCAKFMAAVESKSKGKAPESGSVVKITPDGKVANETSLKYDGGTCTYNGQDCTMSN